MVSKHLFIDLKVVCEHIHTLGFGSLVSELSENDVRMIVFFNPTYF